MELAENHKNVIVEEPEDVEKEVSTNSSLEWDFDTQAMKGIETSIHWSFEQKLILIILRWAITGMTKTMMMKSNQHTEVKNENDRRLQTMSHGRDDIG